MVNFLLQRDNIVAQIWAFVIQFHLLTTKQRWPCWTPVAWAAPMWWCPPWTPVAGTEHNRFLRSCFRSSTHRCFQPPPNPSCLPSLHNGLRRDELRQPPRLCPRSQPALTHRALCTLGYLERRQVIDPPRSASRLFSITPKLLMLVRRCQP